MKQQKECPSNWTDYLIELHKEKELPNQILEKFKIFVQSEILNFNLSHQEILSKTKNWFKPKFNLKKIAINKNSTSNYIEFLFITEISQRLFRVINIENLLNLDIELKNLKSLGDKDFFINTSNENQFIF